MATTVDKIHLVWCWCRDAYLRIAGRRLNFPPDTDPTKTYQWRYLTALTEKLDTWGFDDDLCQSFIDAAVRYATKRRLLGKGLSVLLQDNLLDECYEALRAQERKNNDVLEVLARARSWLVQQVASAQTDPVELLLVRPCLGAYTNIVCWYDAGHLPEVYLALSRACGTAIARLARTDAAERVLLPKDYRLYLAQHAALSSKLAKISIKNILQDDWRRPCL